jgi:hypothetical protein
MRYEEEIKITKRGHVLLYLPNQSRPRSIGRIKGDTFHTERNEKRHVHKQHSIGFNYKVMKTGNFTFVTVHILPFGPDLQTTREQVLRRGKIFHFKKQGFERQIFLPIHEFGLQRALAAQQNNSQSSPKQQTPMQQTQLTLFEQNTVVEQHMRSIPQQWSA